MIANICNQDHANYAYDNMMALRSVGLDCQGFKRHKHTFHYSDELPIEHNEGMWRKLIKKADIVQIFHSDLRSLAEVSKAGFSGKLIVHHTGHTYRTNNELLDGRFNESADVVVAALPDLYNLAVKNNPDVKYMISGVDVKKIIPKYGGIGFGHFPSSAKVKGTDNILRMIGDMKGVHLRYSTSPVPWANNMERAKECAFYIELFQPTLDGNPYGNFGMTAMEMAALGKIVITQNVYGKELYENTYGECGFLIANTEEEFIKIVKALMEMDAAGIRETQKLVRKWIDNTHSYEATGKFMKENIL